MAKVKSSKGKKTTGGGKEGLLLPPPDGKFEQRSVDGKTIIKETVSKDIQEAANFYFAAKDQENKAKAKSKTAAEKLLQAMEFEKKTNVVVYNQEEKRKDRIQILQGEEKLKVEKNVVTN